jgi:GGDEF domain-containing protein
MTASPRALRPAVIPAVLLLAAALIVLSGVSLPATLAGMRWLLPALLMLAATGLAAWFNRGRGFIAAASLLAAFAAYSFALAFYGENSIAARAVFTALAVLVPANVLAALLMPERGMSHHFNYRWLIAGAAEVLLAAWVASAGRSRFSGLAWTQALDHWLLRSPPMPVAGRLLVFMALAAAVWRAWPRDPDSGPPPPIETGLVTMLAAFFLACEWAATPAAFGAYSSAAAIALLTALLQESHRLAFRDELTGLRSRRALEERLPGLGPVFTIAMVDVDHFKQFNDTHGHATGDQVLKLVAARLAEAGGGGVAYRYGGEEFAVLFAGRGADEAEPHLEALRAAIEAYRMAVRGPDRPQDPELGTALRHSRPPQQLLSVTVSIGLAEKSRRDRTPTMVLAAADKALYRAKHAGRNRVSR